MAEIFISYKSQNRPSVAKLASILEAEGFSVWWDREVRPGGDFNRTIMAALREAQVVVCLWSESAAQGEADSWVLTEARIAKSRNCLVPVTLDGTPLPVEFANLSRLSLAEQSLRRGDPCLDALLRELYLSVRNREPPSPHVVPKALELSAVKEISPAAADAVKYAEEGDQGASLYDLGRNYLYGMNSVPLNAHFGRRLIRAAADFGHVRAMWHLGTISSDREDGNRDDNLREALYWYRQAAELGQPEAQYNLAIFYHQGIGLECCDDSSAMYWLDRAARLNHSKAQYVLAQFHERGAGEVGPDPFTASRWYLKAGIQGIAAASLALARLVRGKKAAPEIDAAMLLCCFAYVSAEHLEERKRAADELKALEALHFVANSR